MSDKLYKIELSNTGIAGAVYVMDTTKYKGPFTAIQVLSAKAKFTLLESNWEGNPVTELPAGVFCGVFNEVQLEEGIAILYRIGGEVDAIS